jgi:hypothetical protein
LPAVNTAAARHTIRDRVVEPAAVLVLAPIFEADLQPEQYAYRNDETPTMRCAMSTSCPIQATRTSSTRIYQTIFKSIQTT